ncbi:MAG: TetR family transcriptional regulator [Chloroflexi bacterium RBG_16_70_13]|nr:MAG: TetR family transcriptional regulator [Chloroflexi bacterium RBG_16_70_13]
MVRSGRRPGVSGSRERIITAARGEFASRGYDAATVRGIAAAAGVDPALVRHYFGSKEHLFVVALEFPVDPAEFVPRLLEPGIEGLGERITAFFLQAWDTPGGRPFLGLLRSVASNESAAEALRQFVTREVLQRVAAILVLDRPQLRAALAGSHLIGLAMARYVIRVEPIASASPAELARAVGPAIQAYFDRPLPT